jgi:hypothetical protein
VSSIPVTTIALITRFMGDFSFPLCVDRVCIGGSEGLPLIESEACPARLALHLAPPFTFPQPVKDHGVTSKTCASELTMPPRTGVASGFMTSAPVNDST